MINEGKKKVWDLYQKEIADNKYYYARSCIRQTFFPASEWAFIDILRNRLGKDIFDDPKHTTCSGIGYHSDVVPFQTTMTVIARHFALMTEAGYENITPSCITRILSERFMTSSSSSETRSIALPLSRSFMRAE